MKDQISIGVDRASGTDVGVSRLFIQTNDPTGDTPESVTAAPLSRVGHYIIPTYSPNTPGDVQIVNDFLELVLSASGFKTSKNAPCWAKWVDRVDMTIKTGYCFIGDFINDGTAEVPIGKARLILAMVGIFDETTRSGLLKQYRIIKMEPGPNYILRATHIATDNRKGGWALRIRNHVANLLQDIEPHNPGNRFSNVEVE